MADKIFFKTGLASSLPTTKTAGQLLFAIDGTTGSIYLDKDSKTRIKFNADAVKLATPRSINGTSFDGSSDITTTNWGTARNISISDATRVNTGTAVSVNGSKAVTLLLPATIKATLDGNAATATKATSADSATTAASCTGNAATASKLKTGVAINGTTFDGSTAITTANWGTARTITISDNDGTNTQANSGINGSANFTLKLPATIKASLSGNASTATSATYALKMQTYKYNSTTETYGTSYPLYAQWNQQGNIVNLKCDNYTVNTDTATKLATARTINGTAFDGSTNITTNSWGTARDITIGSKTKNVNGSTAYNWTLTEIGATVSNTWAVGTTAGPKISTTVNGVTGIAVEIPSASTSASGVVTTDTQRFRGQKSFEYPVITNNNSRYLGYYYKSSDGTLVADHWLDIGDTSKVTQGVMYWRLYSPKATADTTTTGYYEQYLLPEVTIGRSTNASYEIFTSKSYTTLDNRYVNATGDTMSGKLTLNTNVVDHNDPISQILVINCAQVPSGGTLTDKNAPGIGFHIGNNSWGSLILNSGDFKFINNTATGYMPVYASTFYGDLSGNASTATKLATARNIAISGTASNSIGTFDGSTNTTINIPLIIKGFTSIESDKYVVNDKVTLQYNTTNECLEFIFA